MFFISVAHAHSSALPHVHSSDPAAAALVAFWAIAAIIYLGLAFRGRRSLLAGANGS